MEPTGLAGVACSTAGTEMVVVLAAEEWNRKKRRNMSPKSNERGRFLLSSSFFAWRKVFLPVPGRRRWKPGATNQGLIEMPVVCMLYGEATRG